MGDSEKKSGIQELPNVKKKYETLKEMKHDSAHRKENMSLELTHSGSGVLPESIILPW